VLVALPAFLMGGTLPALVRGLAPDDATVSRASGLLYAANTAGAVAGTLATPFLLVPSLGIRGTALSAAGVNLALAAVAFSVSRRRRVRPVEREGPRPLTADARLAVALYAVAGGIALGYEVVWTQSIVQFLSTRTYAFAVVLATYLAGLVLGSCLHARLAHRTRRPWTVFGLLVAGAGVSALTLLAALGPWLPRFQSALGNGVFDVTDNRAAMMLTRFGVAAFVMILVPTVFLGAAFPAAVRLTTRAARVGRDVGAVLAFNTAGGIAGVFLVGFLVIPALGLVRTLGLLAVASAVVGGIAITRDDRRRGPASALATAMVVAVAVFAVGVPRDKLARLLARERGGALVFYEESPGGTVAVLEDAAAAGTFHRLYIQGVSNSGDALTSLRYMRLQALLPLLIHRGEPRSALVVGLGTGITSGALLSYPGLDRRVCAELLPAVVLAAPHFEGNLNVVDDPRLTIRVRDGRHELLSNTDRYDLITLEPPPPSAAGVVNLYSREFYELARDRLEPDGLFAQWWPLATQNDEDSQSLVRSFIDVFPHATVWTTELHEALLVGSMAPIELDVERIRSRLRQPDVAVALREAGVLSTTELLATYVTDRDGLESYAGGALPVTDDRPRIEHAGWVREGEFPRVLQRIAELRSEPRLVSTDPAVKDDVELARHKLWTLYRAAYYAYAGKADRWEAMIRRLGPEMRENPYFRWFVTDKR
jgi:spermidine synthase